MFVNRGIYHRAWTAVTRHSIPWLLAESPPIDADVWELYAPDGWTQAHDLAEEQPGRLAELERLFLIEAARYNVLPLDDRRAERFNADLAGRPQLIRGKSQLLYEGMGRVSENSVVVVKNKSHPSPPRSRCRQGLRGSRRAHRADALLWRRDHRPRPRQCTPVSDDHGTDNSFTGRVRWVQLDIDEAAEDVDHLITPEKLLRVAMARQ